MATKRNETEYMYASARIRFMENRIASGERLSHLADAESSDNIVSVLPDLGFDVIHDEKGELCREETLSTVLRQGYSEIEKMDCDTEFLKFLRYPYDCHNIKSLIKCFARGIDAKDMMIPLGSVEISELEKAFSSKKYSCLPSNMAKAAKEAEEAFGATANPQKVDLILDKACYADMLDNADTCGVALAGKLVRAKIDLTNIISFVRLSMMKLGDSAPLLLAEALIEGGRLDTSFFKERFSAGVSKLSESLEFTDYSSICQYLSGNISLGELERAADSLWLKTAKEAKFVPFGAEVLIGYLAALEFEVKNIRILLAGKDAGLSAEVIRERLRESYV